MLDLLGAWRANRGRRDYMNKYQAGLIILAVCGVIWAICDLVTLSRGWRVRRRLRQLTSGYADAGRRRA